jgi:hypothetical protein
MKKIVQLMILLSMWAVWPTIAQELNHESSNSVSIPINDPGAHQEAATQAKMTNLRHEKRSLDISTSEEIKSGQDVGSGTWSRFLFPLAQEKMRMSGMKKRRFSGKKNKRGKVSTKRRKKKGHTVRKNGTNRARSFPRSGYIGEEGQRKRYFGNGSATLPKRFPQQNMPSKKKTSAPVAAPVAAPFAAPDASLVPAPTRVPTVPVAVPTPAVPTDESPASPSASSPTGAE